MKQYLHPKYLPIAVSIASVLGLLLRLWTMGAGPDEEGLYAPQVFAWVLLWIVTFATLTIIVLMSSRLKNPGRYSDNFPKSMIGAAGCAAAAFGVLYTSLGALSDSIDLLAALTSVFGVLSGIALMLTAVARFQGKKPSFVLHIIPCLFLALRIFDRCKHWSNLTQTGTFLFQFLASTCVMLAVYQLCCFDVNLGKRRSSLLWSLSGVYFCVLALPMGEEPLFYAGMALWLITNLCSVHPLKTPKPQPAAPEVPITEETAPEAPAAVEESTAPQENKSYEELLNWLDKE